MLSRKNGPTHLPKTGNYSVYVTEFEQLVLPTLQRSDDDGNTVFILDEIGRMELHSKKFISAVRELLQPQDRQQDTPIIQKKTIRLIGAITAPIYGHRVPFCDEVSAHPGVKVHKIRKSNRDDVVNSLIQEIKDRWVDSDTNRNRKQTKKTTSSSSSPAKHAEGNAHGQHHLLDQDPITRIDGKKSKKNDDNDSYTSPPQITATKRKKITHKY
jgi:nucleoside-triphosphatase